MANRRVLGTLSSFNDELVERYKRISLLRRVYDY